MSSSIRALSQTLHKIAQPTMSSSITALSRTLKTITLSKINELEKQRKAYARSKDDVLTASSAADCDQRERICRLLKGVEDLTKSQGDHNDLSNIRRWLEQSQFDASIPDAMLSDFETQLRSHLNVQTRRLDLAALYSRLLTEWLGSANHGTDEAALDDTDSLDGSFEIIQKDRLKQLTDKFEAVVFTPQETDEVEIDNYLVGLFAGDNGKKALDRLRSFFKEKSSNSLRNQTPFDERSITWCLKGLLGNDLLRDDKKAILREFLKDEVARGEICDVLNMKFKDIKNWKWDAGDGGLPVEPRRQVNGKYRIMMDEDVLDAIFLHYIGMTWSVEMKTALSSVLRYTGFWKHNVTVPKVVQERRRYYLGNTRSRAELMVSVEKHRQDMYAEDFFLSQLPSSVFEGAGGYDDDEVIGTSSKKSPKVVKQQLLRLLATEVRMQRALNGQVAVVQSDFQWFATAISHSTVFSVLRFAGVTEEWITLFKKFLEPPLDLGPVSEGEAVRDRARIRKRGVPMAHALEKFFGELILFFMDLAVNQEAGMLLYRFHDDLWLVGDPKKCAAAWQTMKQFSSIMGLEFNNSKTGSVFLSQDDFTFEDSAIAAKLPAGPVSFGFLNLDPASGEWIINKKEVSRHVKQLSKQLANSPTILSWVQTWNSCIGRFFSHTFGEPANCFGKAHVDGILETYKQMQETIFPGSNVCKHLKDMISERFGTTDIPDAFIFLPETLGGLGARNPFIGPFLVRENVCSGPKAKMKEFFKEEEEIYVEAKRRFEEFSEQERRRRHHSVFPDEYGTSLFATTDPVVSPDELDTFMSRDEFVSLRESISPELTQVYKELMQAPGKKQIDISSNARKIIRELDVSPDEEEELRWMLQMYEKELVEMCGGLRIVERNLLPLGILTILRKRKVVWQMVL